MPSNGVVATVPVRTAPISPLRLVRLKIIAESLGKKLLIRDKKLFDTFKKKSGDLMKKREDTDLDRQSALLLIAAEADQPLEKIDKKVPRSEWITYQVVDSATYLDVPEPVYERDLTPAQLRRLKEVRAASKITVPEATGTPHLPIPKSELPTR